MTAKQSLIHKAIMIAVIAACITVLATGVIE
jgi:hypothetical protein